MAKVTHSHHMAEPQVQTQVVWPDPELYPHTSLPSYLAERFQALDSIWPPPPNTRTLDMLRNLPEQNVGKWVGKEGCPEYGLLFSGVGWLPVSAQRHPGAALLPSTKYSPRQTGVNSFRHRIQYTAWAGCLCPPKSYMLKP